MEKKKQGMMVLFIVLKFKWGCKITQLWLDKSKGFKKKKNLHSFMQMKDPNSYFLLDKKRFTWPIGLFSFIT